MQVVHYYKVVLISTITKVLFSMILPNLVNYDYKFLYVDVGCHDRISDVGVYLNSSLHAAIRQGKLDLPNPKTWRQNADEFRIDETQDNIPFLFVGDVAFSLSTNIMKPCSER